MTKCEEDLTKQNPEKPTSEIPQKNSTKIPKPQSNKNNKITITILSHKRVIPGIKANKPIPVGLQPQEHGRSVESEGKRRGTFGVHKIGLSDDIYILGSLEDGDGLDIDGEAVALGGGGEAVEVEEVVVAGVVGGEEEAENLTRVAIGAGEEVGDGGRGSGIGVACDGGDAGGEEKRVGARGGGGGGGRGGEG